MSTTGSDTQSLLEKSIDPKPPGSPPDTPLKVDRAAMTQTIASCILIAFEQQLIGIFTERDLVTITDSDISLSVVVISEVMTESSLALAKRSEGKPSQRIAMNLDRAGNIFRVWGILRGAKIRHLPLTDERRNLLGTNTSESIRQILKPGDFLQMRRETRNYDHTSNSCLNRCISLRNRKTDDNKAQKLHSHLH